MEYDAAISFLRREPLRNQALIASLEAGFPQVPRTVYVDDADQVGAVLVIEHYEYGDGTSADWVFVDAASERAALQVLDVLPLEQQLNFLIHRSWMRDIVRKKFGVEFRNKRYDYTVNRQSFRLVYEYTVTPLDKTHVEVLADRPSVTRPHTPSLLDELERQLRGEAVKVYVLFQGEEVVAYATAEGIVEDIWGVHPHTLEQHRGRGYGRTVMSAATEDVLNMGKIPYYDAGPDNPSAMRVAEVLGYWIYQEVVWT